MARDKKKQKELKRQAQDMLAKKYGNIYQAARALDMDEDEFEQLVGFEYVMKVRKEAGESSAESLFNEAQNQLSRMMREGSEKAAIAVFNKLGPQFGYGVITQETSDDGQKDGALQSLISKLGIASKKSKDSAE